MLRVDDIRFSPASVEEQRRGMLGYIACVLNDCLVLDGLTLRRTRDRRFVLSFPSRVDRRGNRHFLVRPIDDDARCDIEQQILGKLVPEEMS